MKEGDNNDFSGFLSTVKETGIRNYSFNYASTFLGKRKHETSESEPQDEATRKGVESIKKTYEMLQESRKRKEAKTDSEPTRNKKEEG